MRVFLKPVIVIICFGILILMTVAGILMTRRQLAQQMDAEVGVSHTREMLYNLQAIEYLLKDAESGKRGLLLTGDESYLESFDTSVAQVSNHLNRVAELIGNKQEATELERLRTLANDKILEMQEIIDLYHEGRPEDARKLFKTNHGKRTMDKVRACVGGIRAEELRLDRIRSAEYDRSVHKTITSLYLAGAVGIAGLCCLALLILQAVRVREQYMRKIWEREEWLRVTLKSIGDAVIATDDVGKVTYMNPVAERLTGKTTDESFGRPIQEIFPITNEVTGVAAENPVAKVKGDGDVMELANHTMVHVDGRTIPIQDNAAAIRDDRNALVGVVLVFRDVTGERKSQEMLRRSDKLATAAKMSATVAHEINNPLEAVSNLIYLAKIVPGAPAPIIDHLTAAERELARVAHMTRLTLGFYRESNEALPINLGQIVDSVLELYANKIKTKEITVDRQYNPCPPMIGIPGEMRQVMANLISNSIDAVGNNGKISVEINSADEDGKRAEEVTVRDNGPGIPNEILEKLFEPFFTTKRNVGTGLGLYIARDIVERHGGTLEASPSGNGAFPGACFVMRIPLDRSPQHA